MGENAYSSIGKPMDRAWVVAALDKILSGPERPNVYFLPKDDPLWGMSSGDEGAQAMYYGPSITEENPTWDLDQLSTIREMGGIETANNLFLPEDQDVSATSTDYFGHELMHYLDDIMAPDVPEKGFESVFPYISKSDLTQQAWAIDPKLAKYRETIPSTATSAAQDLGAEWRNNQQKHCRIIQKRKEVIILNGLLGQLLKKF